MREKPPAELAGELRTVVNRLAFLLRSPATRHGITPTRLSAMVALSMSGPQRPGDLADRLGLSGASMSRLIQTLEAGQWVNRSPDPEDRRACLIGITGQGLAALDSLRREGTSQLTDDILALTDDQRESLANALPALTALADRHLGCGPTEGTAVSNPSAARAEHAPSDAD
jgi:DNA-binding MarR family transcriptional regulator